MAPQQRGFTAGKSTLSNLLEYVDYLSNNIMGGGQVDAIYMDLAKAFDRISHKILIKKLRNLPISKCLVQLLQSYLIDRKQIVCVYGEQSNCITPKSSVPQGSILSPLLFALFINDLPPLIKSKILLFADDVKIFLKIRDLNDTRQLQNDINTILDWCNENGLQLNSNKCYTMSFTRRHESTFQFFNYNINGVTINRINTIRDLGVMFDSKLSFANHVEIISNGAFKMLGFISRSLNKFKMHETYNTLYNLYVRSALEYCSSIWSPHYNNHIHSIERVQQRFTRAIYRKFHYPREEYVNRLVRLNMLSLEHRRLLNDELNLYKLYNGIFNTDITLDLRPNPIRFTRHNRTFYLPAVTTNVEYYSPVNRMQR